MDIITKQTIPKFLNRYSLQYNLDEHTVLHYIEIQDWDNIGAPKNFEISYRFYGEQYFAKIFWEDIERNYNVIYNDGPSILFSSSKENLEDNHWELLCELCNKYVKNENN